MCTKACPNPHDQNLARPSRDIDEEEHRLTQPHARSETHASADSFQLIQSGALEGACQLVT